MHEVEHGGHGPHAPRSHTLTLPYLTVHYSLPSTLCMDDPCRRCCELLPKSAVSSSWMRQVPLWY